MFHMSYLLQSTKSTFTEMNVLAKTLTNAACNRLAIPNLQNTIARSVAFKSALSLEHLYPNSSLTLTTPTKPASARHEKFSGYIPIERLQIAYSRSTGPGGQNVNKVNTKVDLRFHLESAEWLEDEVKRKLSDSMKAKITKDGFLVFRSDLTRSQQLNLADCLEKLRSSIEKALEEPQEVTQESLEKIRRKKEKAARERVALKRGRGQTKNERQAPGISYAE